MRRFFPFVAAVALALAAMVQSCSKGQGDTESPIRNYDINEVLKSASRYYRVVLDGDTFNLSIYTSIQWPEKFGDSNVGPLRDSLLSRMYQVPPGTDVDEAILGFINDKDIFDADAEYTEIDSIDNDGPDGLWITYTAKLQELTERTVSYLITTESYLGGAHPNYATFPFTYDLLNGQLIDGRYLFTPGSEAELTKMIKQSLADMEETSVRRLPAKGYFVKDMEVSPILFIQNGNVVFHYNPYEIAPYSKGTVDIPVEAYELSKYLTPRADSLLNN